MAVADFGGRGGIHSDVNVIPLIDILLVLLVIFMIIPRQQMGLPACLPSPASTPNPPDPRETIIVQVAADGAVRINQSVVQLDELRSRLGRIFALPAKRVAFLQRDRSLEFQTVAQVLDLMHLAGASPVGLLSSELEKNR
jgi:biopolymer transport protein ExbD